METAQWIAASLCVLVGLAHSVLGERYILKRLFRRSDIPKLFGGTAFTTRTLRFAWHLTTLAWWGFAALLVQLAQGTLDAAGVAMVIAAVFLSSTVLALVVSRGRHLAWLVFLCVGAVALYAAMNI